MSIMRGRQSGGQRMSDPQEIPKQASIKGAVPASEKDLGIKSCCAPSRSRSISTVHRLARGEFFGFKNG